MRLYDLSTHSCSQYLLLVIPFYASTKVSTIQSEMCASFPHMSNLKLSLCRLYRGMGSRRCGFTHTHPQQQITVSGSFQPLSLYTLEKKRQFTSGRRLGGPLEAVWTLREEERLLLRPKIELRFVAYPTVSLITIPTELFRISLSCFYCLYIHRRNLFVN